MYIFMSDVEGQVIDLTNSSDERESTIEPTTSDEEFIDDEDYSSADEQFYVESSDEETEVEGTNIHLLFENCLFLLDCQKCDG